MKEHFELKDNVIDKNLTQFIKSKDFAKRKQLHYAIDDLFQFFAFHFTANNKNKSKQVLDSVNTKMRRKDAVLISYFAGASTVLLIFGLFFMMITSSNSKEENKPIISSQTV